MLDLLEASHFIPLTRKSCTLHLGDGRALQMIVDEVVSKPQSRNPYTTGRIPFSVYLTAVDASDFLEGPCALDLENFERLEGIHVSRVAPLGRDPAKAYYQIIFN